MFTNFSYPKKVTHPAARRWLSRCLFGIVYFVLAAAAIKLTRFHGGVALISVANAVLLARLLTLRPHHWAPYIVTAAGAGAIATVAFGLGAYAALPMAVMNLGEVAVAAVILHQASPERGLGSHAAH